MAFSRRFITTGLLGSTALVALSVTSAFAKPPAQGPGLAAHPATRPTTRPALALITPPTTRPTAAEIEQLLNQLAGDTWKERQQAQDRLVQLGEDVEARLQQLIAKTRNPEAATRAQTALRMIADNRLVGTTLVSLNLKDATPAAVFKELGLQVHTEILPEPPELWQQKEWPKITVQADHQPFWSVFRQVCRDAGVEPETNDAAHLHVIEGAGDWVNFPATVTGPFLILANNIARTNSVKFSQPANVERTCNLQLDAYAEPKLRVLPDSAAATIEEAVDEKGNSLLPATEANEPSLSNGNNGRLWDLEIELTYPPDAGKEIAWIKGSLHFLVPIRIESLQVEDVLTAHGVLRSAAGRRVLIRKVKAGQGGNYEVQVTIYRDELTDEEWQQLSNPREFVHLLDDKNRPLTFSGIGESDGGDKLTTMTLQFEPATGAEALKNPTGKPAKLIWEIPLESREIRVPFEFTHLTLP